MPRRFQRQLSMKVARDADVEIAFEFLIGILLNLFADIQIIVNAMMESIFQFSDARAMKIQ